MEQLATYLETHALLLEQEEITPDAQLTHSERSLLFENTLMKSKSQQASVFAERSERIRQIELCLRNLERVFLDVKQEIQGPKQEEGPEQNPQSSLVMELYFLPWFERIQARMKKIERSIQNFTAEQSKVEQMVVKAQASNPESKAVAGLLLTLQAELETNLLLEARLAAEELIQAELQEEPNMLWAKYKSSAQETNKGGSAKFSNRLLPLQHTLSDEIQRVMQKISAVVQDTVKTE